MMYRRSILVLAGSILLIVGSSLAELDTNISDGGLVTSGEGLAILTYQVQTSDGDMMSLDTGQNITGLLALTEGIGSGGIANSGQAISKLLTITGEICSPALLENNPPIWKFGTLSGNINSGKESDILSDTSSRLILSEVYYDGTDERIEITNIGNDNFQGNFTLSGVKSTPVSLSNVSIPASESRIFGDNLAQISGSSFIGKTGLAFNITDTASINIQLSISGQIVDNFIVDQFLVNAYNDKKTSFEKHGESITGVTVDRIVNAQVGYIINPGKYFIVETGIDDNLSPPLQTGTVSDISPRLILSEVYYDGMDEWIEITNIGDGNFQGDFTLLGVKSTPVALTNISILAGESKLFGDNLAQISGSSFIGKTGLAFNIADTAPINIQLDISGQIVDSFVVDQYRVNKYNDKKTSFEKVGEVSTQTSSSRIINAQNGYTINPGVYFKTGIEIVSVSNSIKSGIQLQLPISCDSIDERDLIKINEIFPGNEKYPPYIELAIHDNIALDSLSISGDRLATGLEFSFTTSGTTLEKNSLLLISATGFWQDEGMQSVRNSDFYLLSTGNWLVITIGSGQSRRVMDIVYLSGNILGKSSYYNAINDQCARILDYIDDFSPGFERKFLKYSPISTITKIEYISVATGNQSGTGSCQTPSQVVAFSGQNLSFSGYSSVVTNISSVENEYTIRILNIDYDPDGSDTNNEKITLLATHISGNQTPLDVSKIFRFKVNGINKTLSGILPMNVPTTFTKTFGFPNSTKSGEEVIVQLTYNDHIFDTYTYNPRKLSSQDEEELTTTGYAVSSVIDGDTFRIKYQGKTQSIRLLGIDAPESTKTRYKYLECFGTEAKNYLKSLIDKKKITFQFDPSQDQKDIYDRLLAYVFIDGENINQTMIEDGYAKEYTYKTAYSYQSQFKQAEQSAQTQGVGLWNENTCGVSMSGVHLTGDIASTVTILDLSGLQFTITYVLPNPKGSDKAEELGVIITNDEGQITNTQGTKSEKIIKSGEDAKDYEPKTIDYLDLSQGFTLRIGTSKKKINGIVHIGQENILSGSLGLVNKAACISLFYNEQELTKFCYKKPKEGQKIYSSAQGLEETPQENLDILNGLQLKKIGNQLCIWYKEQSFLCKRIPASKAELKATQEQKMYKGFASLIKQYIVNNWKNLYYDTPIKEYFDLIAKNKKLIAQGISQVDIYGQSIPITDLKQQLKIFESTLPTIVAIFDGMELLRYDSITN